MSKVRRVSEGRAEQPRKCPGLPKSCGGSPWRKGDRSTLRCEVCGPSAWSVQLSLGLPLKACLPPVQSSMCPEGPRPLHALGGRPALPATHHQCHRHH